MIEVTKEEFKDYVDCQKSGVTNMINVTLVSGLTGLSREQIFYIMKNYKKLAKEYKNKG